MSEEQNTMQHPISVILCGVGGQGTILAADLLAKAALGAGYSVKVSEIHGMSQRGGAVSTVVRFGKDALASMVASPGTADCVVSFERIEALRNARYLKKDGFLLVADEEIKPLPVATGAVPAPQQVTEELLARSAVLIPAGEIARAAGSPKSTNVVLLGALATHLDFPQDIWEDVIAKRVPPKTIEANIEAFRQGLHFAREHQQGTNPKRLS